MKLLVDGIEVYELNDTQKKVIMNDINEDIFIEDMQRRVKYIIEHKYEQCMKRLEDKWIPELSKTLESIPTNKDQLAELIFTQPSYKDAKVRNNEEMASMGLAQPLINVE